MRKAWVWRRSKVQGGRAVGNLYAVQWLDLDGRRRTEAVRGGRKEAERRRIEVEAALNDLAPPRSRGGRGITWQEFADEDVAALTATARPTTVRRTKDALARFAKTVGVFYLADLTPALAEAYIQRRLDGGVSAVTVGIELRHIRASLNRAVRRGHIGRNPLANLKAPQGVPREPRILTPDEEARLLAKCAEPVLEALIKTALATGMRLGELLRLKWADLDLATGAVYVRSEAAAPTKSGKPRWVSVDPGTLAYLKGFNRAHPGAHPFGPDTPTRRRWLEAHFRAAVTDAQIPAVRIHDLRATSLSRLAAAGLPPVALREWGGHSSITTTLKHYVRLEADGVLKAVAAARRCNRIVTAGPSEKEADRGADDTKPYVSES